MNKQKLIEFVDGIIKSYKLEAGLNIDEMSTKPEEDYEELEEKCETWKNEFIELLEEA